MSKNPLKNLSPVGSGRPPLSMKDRPPVPKSGGARKGMQAKIQHKQSKELIIPVELNDDREPPESIKRSPSVTEVPNSYTSRPVDSGRQPSYSRNFEKIPESE